MDPAVKTALAFCVLLAGFCAATLLRNNKPATAPRESAAEQLLIRARGQAPAAALRPRRGGRTGCQAVPADGDRPPTVVTPSDRREAPPPLAPDYPGPRKRGQVQFAGTARRRAPTRSVGRRTNWTCPLFCVAGRRTGGTVAAHPQDRRRRHLARAGPTLFGLRLTGGRNLCSQPRRAPRSGTAAHRRGIEDPTAPQPRRAGPVAAPVGARPASPLTLAELVVLADRLLDFPGAVQPLGKHLDRHHWSSFSWPHSAITIFALVVPSGDDP